MGTSRIEIIKRAASASGNGGLITLDDNEEVARIADEHYEAIARELMTQHSWKFARRSEPIIELEERPEPPWSRLYARPPLLLSLSYVQAGGMRVECEERDTIATAAIAAMCAGPAWAVGTYRVSEDRWPADFARAVQDQMEAVFLAGIAEQRSEAQNVRGRSAMIERRARVRDQRASTGTDSGDWDLTRARRRGSVWAAAGRGSSRDHGYAAAMSAPAPQPNPTEPSPSIDFLERYRAGKAGSA